MNALVIGVGNRHRRDDAAGPLVADALSARGRRTAVAEGDLSDLFTRWSADDDVVIVDAIADDGEPGTVRSIDRIERDPRPFSSHGLGLAEAIALAARLDRLPRSLTVVAITGRDFAVGEPSDELCATIAIVADRVDRFVSRRPPDPVTFDPENADDQAVRWMTYGPEETP